MPTYMQCIARAIDNRASLLSMACAEVYTLCGGVEVWRCMCRTGGIYRVLHNCLSTQAVN